MKFKSRTSTSAAIALAAAAFFSSAAGAAGAPGATSYAVDATHTYATFEIDHFGASVNRGRFDRKEGVVTLNKAAKTGTVDITFDTASVNTGSAGFDKHLQSKDLFNVEKFPTMKFSSKDFVFDGAGKVTEVRGTLTLLGVTQPLTLKANQFNCYNSPMLKREVCGGDFVGTLDRTQFGMNYGVDWGFAKNVRLVVQVEAVAQ